MIRFSIRDVLWLTVVVAVVVAWWTDRGRLEDNARKLKTDLQMQRAFDDVGGSVY